MQPLTQILIVLATDRENNWQRYLRRSGLTPILPGTYRQAIAAVAGFADPTLYWIGAIRALEPVT